MQYSSSNSTLYAMVGERGEERINLALIRVTKEETIWVDYTLGHRNSE
jgi:hypothetical protein